MGGVEVADIPNSGQRNLARTKGDGYWWNYKGSTQSAACHKNTALTQNIPSGLAAQIGRGPSSIHWAQADAFGAVVAQFEPAPRPGVRGFQSPPPARPANKVSWFWSPMAVVGTAALVAVWWAFGLVCFHDASLAPWTRLLGALGFLVSGLVPLSLYGVDPLWIKDGRLDLSPKDSISLGDVRGVKLVCEPLGKLPLPRHLPLLILGPDRNESVAIRTLASFWWDASPSTGSIRRAKRLAAWLSVPYSGTP
jgi:hypothetical protein